MTGHLSQKLQSKMAAIFFFFLSSVHSGGVSRGGSVAVAVGVSDM